MNKDETKTHRNVRTTDSAGKPAGKPADPKQAQADALKQAQANAAGGTAGVGASSTTLADRAGTAVGQVINYEEDAGAGKEGADGESYAIPFLILLQPLSPVVVDETVEGAKAGLYMNTVTEELFGPECFFIPCAFERRFIRWGARDTGGGFKGVFTPAEASAMLFKSDVRQLDNRLYYPMADGAVDEKRSDRLSDTRSHYGLLLPSEGADYGTPIILSLSSTGIKVSKNFLSRIDAVKETRASGGTFTPASYSRIYKLGMEKKSNEKGTWFLPTVSVYAKVDSPVVYEMAKKFNKLVLSGAVQAAHDSMAKQTGGAAQEPDDGRV